MYVYMTVYVYTHTRLCQLFTCWLNDYLYIYIYLHLYLYLSVSVHIQYIHIRTYIHNLRTNIVYIRTYLHTYLRDRVPYVKRDGEQEKNKRSVPVIPYNPFHVRN